MGLDNFRDDRQDLSEKSTCELKSEVPARRKYGRRTKRSPEVTYLAEKNLQKKEVGKRGRSQIIFTYLLCELGVYSRSKRKLLEGSERLFDLWVNVFHQLWTIFSHYIYRCFFCPISLFPILLWHHLAGSHISKTFYSVVGLFFSFFFLFVVQFGSFHWPVFTDSFFIRVAL